MTEAIRLYPERAEPYYNRGSNYQRLQKLPEALADFSKAIAKNPRMADSYYNRGCVYFDQGNEACIADFQQAVKLDPHLVQSYFNIGSFLFQRGNKADGIAYIQRAAIFYQQMGNHQNYFRVLETLRSIQGNF